MWLLRIQDCIRGNRYASEEEFRDDISQIEENAIAYNSPGHGKRGDRGGFSGIAEANASLLLKPMPAHTVVLHIWHESAGWRKALTFSIWQACFHGLAWQEDSKHVIKASLP